MIPFKCNSQASLTGFSKNYSLFLFKLKVEIKLLRIISNVF